MHAEAVANQASCPQCGTYGRFNLVSEDRRNDHIKVSCRQCTHEWTIEA
jgi:hypothetical protein